MEEIIYYFIASLCWILFYQLYLIKAVAKKSVSEWKIWAMSDDGQNTLIEILGSENGVIDHIAYASKETIKSMFEGGFGAVAKSLSSDPKTAMSQGIASQLKDMKWYESALLMKIAQSIPELQPLLGLVGPIKEATGTPTNPQSTPKQPQNL